MQPYFSSLSPSSGSTQGGTTVTARGAGFGGEVKLSLKGANAALKNFKRVSGREGEEFTVVTSLCVAGTVSFSNTCSHDN